MNVTT